MSLLLLLLQHQYHLILIVGLYHHLILIVGLYHHLILIVGLYHVQDRRPFPHLSITMSPAMVLEGSHFPLTVSPTMVLEKTPFPLTLSLTMVPQETPFPSCEGKINGVVSVDNEVLVHSVRDAGRWDKFAGEFS